MQEYLIAHVLGCIALSGITAAFIARGARAHKHLATTFPHMFRWTRAQRVVGGLSFALLTLAVVMLPYLFESTRLTSYFDVAVALAITGALLWGVSDSLNRRVVMSDSSVGAVTWTGSVKQVPWEQLRHVTFHDFYGGFFRLHARRETLFMPVQIERFLKALALLEANSPRSALETAKRGIAISRAVMER